MRVALAQTAFIPGDVDANCAKIIAWSRLAKEKDCELIVFPELSDTGYDLRSLRKNASSWSDAPMSLIKKNALQLNITIACGVSERESGVLYNSLAVIGTRGQLLGSYRKTHLFGSGASDEKRYFTAGTKTEITNLGVLRLGLQICYDLRFPELSRTLALQGADTLLFSAAWPAQRIEHWHVLLRARAIENQCFVVAVNRIGTDAKLTFGGCSTIIAPDGAIVAAGGIDKEELVIGEISRNAVIKVRSGMKVVKDRRNDLYVI